MSASDLSAYELLRLENIRRNAEFLAQLGIQPVEQKEKEGKKSEGNVIRKKKAEKAVRNAKNVDTAGLVPRRSSRLSGGKVSSPGKVDAPENDQSEPDASGVNYESIPQVIPFVDLARCNCGSHRLLATGIGGAG
jgi:hypothetical protein